MANNVATYLLLFVLTFLKVKAFAIGDGERESISKITFRLEQRNDFVCPDNEGFFPAVPGQCSGLYYACFGGIPYPQQCPGDYVFDPVIQHCVPYEDATCVDAPTTISSTTEDFTVEITTTTTTTTTPTSIETMTHSTTKRTTPTSTEHTTPPTTTLPPYPTAPYTCTNDGSFPITRNNCTSDYYSCISGEAYFQTCSGSEVFDPVTFKCTVPEQASCSQKFNCSADGLFPYPGACTHFYYVCSAGQSYLEYCPENYVFDPITYRCTVVGSASCTPGTYSTAFNLRKRNTKALVSQ